MEAARFHGFEQDVGMVGPNEIHSMGAHIRTLDLQASISDDMRYPFRALNSR